MNKLRKHGVYYDSRIKLLLILLTSALAFALGGGLTGLLLFGVVCLFALLSGLWKTSIKVAIVYIVLLMLAQVLPIHLSSVITFFLLRQHRTIAEASAVESPIRQETIGFPAHFFARAHNFKPPGRACQPEADSPMRT